MRHRKRRSDRVSRNRRKRNKMFNEADIVKHLLGFAPLKFQGSPMGTNKWTIEYKATNGIYHGTTRDADTMTEALGLIFEGEKEVIGRLLITPAVPNQKKEFVLINLDFNL
jgi:hypothetical protein